MRRTVLVVDDNPINREILSNIISSDYDVAVACDGREAMAAVERDYLELSAVLLDLSMPVMDGFAVLTAMRAEPNYRQIPVVVTTAQTDTDAEVKALQMGANDYVTKPYSPAIIRQRLCNAINLRETAAEVNELQKDRLTGLFSRTAFFERAEAMIAEKEPGHYVMACFDIDNFKVINDLYGTEKGDEVLRFLADAFRDGFGAAGGICCRMMADNFAVLYPHAFMNSAGIEELRRKVTVLDGSIQPIAFSVGRYIIDDLSLSVSAMYDRAALAESTIKGRYDIPIAVYSDSMREALLSQQQVVSQMEPALEQGQFEPWFQPQYNHATGKLIGAEALARWRHPTEGMIPPGVFVPIFEKNGFIYELDKCIWDKTCAYLRRWTDEGRKPLPVSVNISRYDVFRDDLIDVLTGLLKKYDLPVTLLRLEITESAFSKVTDQIISVVKRLVALGFTVEIDDFGSGYSSLNTLKDVPAQTIKLDMKFLESSDESRRGGNIVESMVRMVKWLDMSVIAEGVETVQQADFLKSIGCFLVQGYLYAKPMPVSEYEALAGSSIKQRFTPVLETVENMDNNAFWDPKSMDTLIFNSYVGGACIYEFHAGRLELLRANDKFFRVLSGVGMKTETAMKLNWTDYMEPKGRERLLRALEKVAENKEESTGELLFLNLPGCDEKVWLRSTMRVIAKVGDRLLIYCAIENITQQRLAEQKRRESDELLAFLESAARELLTLQDPESGIRELLRKMLAYFDGNRCYIFEYDYHNGVTDNTYEVCAEGVTPEREQLQKVPLSIMPSWTRTFENDDYIEIGDVGSLSATREEKQILQAQGIDSLVAVPLRRDGKLIGFVGVDDPRRRQDQIASLSALGDYSIVLLTRRDLARALDSENAEKLSLIDGIPGGLVRMQALSDGTCIPLYFSEGLKKLLNMTQAELDVLYGENAMNGVHPDDLPYVQKKIAEMLRTGEGRNIRYRLQRGGGGYIWVSIFGKVQRKISGETFLNIYYSDATEEKKQEELQIELLDNLPCGAALYAIDNGKPTPIHLNRQYWQLVGRPSQRCEEIDVEDAVLPEDRHIIADEIAAALSQNRDASCRIRIKCGDGSFRVFYITGKFVRQNNGRMFLCAAYTPVSDASLRMQELLPVILSTIMAATSDYSFVKDEELKYICGSEAFAKLTGLASAQDVIGKSDYELFSKEIADKYRSDDEALLNSDHPIVDMVEEIPGENGIKRYSSTSKYLLRDSGGEVIGLYGVGRDITESRGTENWLKLLADNTPGGIATYKCSENSAKLLFFNDGLCRIFGLSREDYERECNAAPFCHVLKEDLPAVREQVNRLVNGSTDADCTFRVRGSGGVRWVSLYAKATQRIGDSVVINAVLIDVTKQQEVTEKLRLSEEEYRLAIEHTGNVVCRFNIAEKTLIMTPDVAEACGLPQSVADMPAGMLRLGAIPEGSEKVYVGFYNKILRGEKRGSMIYQCKMRDGSLRWLNEHFSTVFSDGKPKFAVVSYCDITEQQEKELIYKKWRQSLRGKKQEDYTLFRCNISRGSAEDTREGDLLVVQFSAAAVTFNERTAEYAKHFVFEKDRADYIAMIDSDVLLAGYYRGVRYRTAEYREMLPGGGTRWLRVTVELVEYPNSSDVEAYLMYENIDSEKQSELQIRAHAETDPLTGILNRAAFAEQMQLLLSQRKKGSLCALLMLDLDDFKQLNDFHGHIAGDRALVEVGERLQSTLRDSDLVGRLGGDEFLVCLSDMPNRAVVTRRAEALCQKLRAPLSTGVQLAASMGISVCPDDGEDFVSLYRKADAALYHAKRTGKDHHAFYSEGMDLDLAEHPLTKRGK